MKTARAALYWIHGQVSARASGLTSPFQTALRALGPVSGGPPCHTGFPAFLAFIVWILIFYALPNLGLPPKR